MNTKVVNPLCSFTVLTAVAFAAFFISACDSNIGSGISGAKSETFTAIDGGKVLRILSRSEAELTTEGQNFVGTYTEQDGQLRVVLEILGTQKAIYFNRTATGVRSQDGLELYAPQQYTEVMERITAERRQIALNDSLLQATESGDINHVVTLIRDGANPNIENSNGLSPLTLAMRSGSLESVNSLIEAKAHINHQNSHGWSPLHFASEIGGRRGLLEYGRDRTATDDSVLKRLIESGAQLDLLTIEGYTPLMIATKRQNIDAIRLLVAAGAQRNLSAKGETLWQMAKGHDQTLDALRTPEEAERFRRSRTETKVLATFRDWDHGVGRERDRGEVRITDVAVHVTRNVSRESPIYYAELPQPPRKDMFKQTAFMWTGYTVNLKDNIYIVFKSESERDQCFATISQAYKEWHASFGDVR